MPIAKEDVDCFDTGHYCLLDAVFIAAVDTYIIIDQDKVPSRRATL